MKKLLLVLVIFAAAACGGKKANKPTTPMNGSGSAMPDNKMDGNGGDKKPDGDKPAEGDPCAVPPS